MTDSESYLSGTNKLELFTELSTSSDRRNISITPENADKLADSVTKRGRKAFLSAVFDELGVPDRDGWSAPDEFRTKHADATDEAELQFRRRYEDAYSELATRGSEHVVAKFTPDSVTVEFRQAAPDDMHADERDELDAWEQEVLGETFEWVDGTFEVVEVETELEHIDGRKASHRVFTLEYRDGETESMPVSIHKLHVDADHISKVA